MMDEWKDEWKIDAAKFQNQLGELTTTIAYKVQREGGDLIRSRTAAGDIYTSWCAWHSGRMTCSFTSTRTSTVRIPLGERITHLLFFP
jgi:hypothetical protein